MLFILQARCRLVCGAPFPTYPLFSSKGFSCCLVMCQPCQNSMHGPCACHNCPRLSKPPKVGLALVVLALLLVQLAGQRQPGPVENCVCVHEQWHKRSGAKVRLGRERLLSKQQCEVRLFSDPGKPPCVFSSITIPSSQRICCRGVNSACPLPAGAQSGLPAEPACFPFTLLLCELPYLFFFFSFKADGKNWV